MVRHFLFGAAAFFCWTSAFGQKDHIDSLTNLLNSRHSVTETVDVYNELSSALYNYDIEKAYRYATEAYTRSESASYTKGMRYALILQGFYFYGNGSYQRALAHYRDSRRLETVDDDLKAYNRVMMGNTFQALARYDSARSYYDEAVAIERRIGSDTYLAYAYKNLGRLYVLQWENDLALEYFTKALSLYEHSGNVRSIADTWFSLADVKINQGQNADAVSYIEQACAVGDQLDDEFLKLYCYINRGEILYNRGDYTTALDNLFRAVEIMAGIEMPGVLARLYTDLGDVYEALGQNELSLKYYLEALKIAERLGIRHEIAKIKSSMSWIYKNQFNFRQAHELNNQSLVIRQEIGDEHGIGSCYNVLGLIYLVEKKYDSALHFFDRSLAIRRKIGYKYGVSAALFNKGLVLEEQRDYQGALKMQLEALGMEEEIGNQFSLGISYNSIGNLYTSIGDFRKAADYLQRATEMGKLTGSLTLRMNSNFYWARYYEARGDYAMALRFHKRYAELNDSIYNDVSAGKLAELQALYQVEKKDQEIQLLSREKQLHEAQIRLQRSQIDLQTIIIVSIVIVLVLVSLLAFKNYQYNVRMRKANREITEQKEEIQSQSEELIEANATIASINKELENKIVSRTKALTRAYKELDTFFYRSSHDFRRPLTTFLGLTEVAKVTVKDPNALELFEKVRETAANLDKMLVKLQSISDVGSQEMVYKEVLLREIFDNVCDSFRDELQRKSIRTTADINLTVPFVSYPAMVKTILENLVENAIQFCGVENCFVKFKVTGDRATVTMEIVDNGQGINPEYHDQVFEMYFRGSERSKGNGLGLYIVKKAVEKLEGAISFTSHPGRGTAFTITLPNHG